MTSRADSKDLRPIGSCPSCGGELGVVFRVRFVESAGYTPLFPPGTLQETADCRSCDGRFQREDGGPWRPLSFEEEFAADEDIDAVLDLERLIETIEAAFPGRFGGSWVDSSTCPAKVCIGLVDGTPTDRGRILRFFVGPPDRLVLVPTKYSADQLDAYHAAVFDVVRAHANPQSTTISVGSDYSANRVTVRMNAPDPDVETRIRSAAPADVLTVSIDPAHHLRPIA